MSIPRSMRVSPLTLAAAAKVNLALAVGGPDDSGYHPIASWMLAVDLCDALTLRHDVAATHFDIRFAEDAPVSEAGQAIDWPIDQDLAFAAHQMLERAVGAALPIEARLDKRIPPAMGLGGGSSDAAAMLVGLDRLFGLGLGVNRLMAVAAALGSDVPFLVQALARGEPAALVTGRGETCEPMRLAGAAHLVLVLPALQCSTGAVYQAFDRLYPAAGEPREAAVRAMAQAGMVRSAGLFNDLAAPACSVTPGLRATAQRVAAAIDRPVHVTGSGAGLFVVADSPDHAGAMARHIAGATGLAARAVRAFAG